MSLSDCGDYLLWRKHIEDGELLLGSLRVRLLDVASVPVLGDCNVLRGPILLIDEPDPDQVKADENEGEDKENISRTLMATPEKSLDNSTLEKNMSYAHGSPLKFEFLTLDKLRSGSSEIQVTFRRASTTDFPLNPLQSKKALTTRQLLYNKLRSRRLFSPDFSSLVDVNSNPAVFVSADGSDALRSIFVGFLEHEKTITSFLSICPGSFNESGRLRLECQLQRFSSEKYDSKSRTRIVHTLLKSGSSTVAEGGVPACAFLTIDFASSPLHFSGDFTYLKVPTNATAIARFAPGWRDSRVSYFERAEELNFMLTLSAALHTGTEVKWPATKSNFTEADMVSQIKQLIYESKDIKKSAGDRFVDLTERLWLVMQGCSSYSMLVAGFRVLFEALRRGEIHAALHEENRSQLARLIVDSCKGERLHLPRLEGLTPVELLLQIAVERFRRDTLYEFATKEFIGSDQDVLSWVKTPSNSAELEDETSRLLPLHLALQTMDFFSVHLDLPKHELFQHTKEVIRKYSTIPLNQLDQFSFELKIPIVSVSQAIRNSSTPAQTITDTVYVCRGDSAATTSLLTMHSPPLRFLQKFVDEGDPRLALLTTASFLHKKDVSPIFLT